MDISFNELSHSIDIGEASSNEFSLNKLLDYKKSSNFIENQWNCKHSIDADSTLVLGFVFGRSSPRAGREGSLVTGVLIYILYLSFLVGFQGKLFRLMGFLVLRFLASSCGRSNVRNFAL